MVTMGHIDIADLPELEKLAEEVRDTGEPRVLRAGDEDIAILMPITRRKELRKPRKTKNDIESLLSAAGGWEDVDIDRLLSDIYSDRRASNRVPVDL